MGNNNTPPKEERLQGEDEEFYNAIDNEQDIEVLEVDHVDDIMEGIRKRSKSEVITSSIIPLGIKEIKKSKTFQESKGSILKISPPQKSQKKKH